MIIKLLKDQATSVNETIEIDGVNASIEFDVKSLNSSMQARLLDKATRIVDAESRLAYFREQMRCIDGDNIKVNGEDISAEQLAELGDFTHATTGAIIAIVSKSIDKVVFLDDEEVKK